MNSQTPVRTPILTSPGGNKVGGIGGTTTQGSGGAGGGGGSPDQPAGGDG